jgi:hypothetical protein
MKPGRAIRRCLIFSLAAALAGSLLAACSRGVREPEGPRTLRIGVVYGSAYEDDHVRQTLTDAFEVKMAGAVEIEIVPAIDSDRFKFMAPDGQQKPPTCG